MPTSSKELCNTKPIADMTREELISELYWNAGGDSRDFIGTIIAGFHKPEFLRSPVCIGLLGENAGDGFEDGELRELTDISRLKAQQFLSNPLLQNILSSDNLHVIRKCPAGKWSWRQLSWDSWATLYFESLEALKVMLVSPPKN